MADRTNEERWRLVRVATTTVVAVGAASVILVGGISPASAHNVLVGSTPQDGATVAAPPEAVVLDFDQPVGADFTTVVVLGATARTTSPATPRSSDERSPRPSTNSTPGQVDVSYRIVSADGHPVTGTIRFTVAPQATAEPSIEPTVPRAEPSAEGQSFAPSVEATAVASDEGNSSGTPMPVLVAVGGIAAALAIAGTYLAMGGRQARATVAEQLGDHEDA